jgi:hypothetical protein
MWTVSKDEVAELLKLDVMARLREAKEKESLLERTNRQSFEAFEQTVLQGEEDFEQWDDYIEWKAYRSVRRDLEQKMDALNRIEDRLS